MNRSGLPIAQWRLANPPDLPLDDDAAPLTRARVLAITDRCWRCRTKVRGIVGVLIEMSAGRRFVPFAEVADALARSADPRALAARGIGPLRHRDSPGVLGGYLSNGCVECDALVGRLLLEDLLDEHLRNGGTYAQLDTGLALELHVPTSASLLRRIA